jgi:hypothetical protein
MDIFMNREARRARQPTLDERRQPVYNRRRLHQSLHDCTLDEGDFEAAPSPLAAACLRGRLATRMRRGCFLAVDPFGQIPIEPALMREQQAVRSAFIDL